MIKLSNRQLKEKAKFIYKYMMDGNNATKSEVDPNSNVSTKNVATLAAEMNKPDDMQVNRYMLGEKIKELFGWWARREYYKSLNNHEIYSHDESAAPSKAYCVAIDLHPFLERGMLPLGGDSKSPQHLASFAGSYINLIFAISSQFAGAVADASFLTYFDYFARKDFGDDYLETHSNEIENAFQHIIYSLNQPAAARGFQSVFYNTSVFDMYYFEALFGKVLMPDGTNPTWKQVDKIQRFFMTWFNNERTKALLTFPVVSAAYLTENKMAKDISFKEFLAEQMAEGNSFFHYSSDSVDSLASCCFDGQQKVLVRRAKDGVSLTSFQELYDSKYRTTDVNYSIFHNGSWVDGKLIDLPSKPLYKVTTANKKIIYVTEDHLNPSLRGDVETVGLTTDDYLLFNCRALDTFPEKDLGLSYEEGILIGMYLGDGSTYIKNDTYRTTHLSLNKEKFSFSEAMLKKAISKLDAVAEMKLGKEYNHVYPVSVYSSRVSGFIKTWVYGDYAPEKELNMDVLLQSQEFRKGILDGYYATDGGNSNRIYTTSEKLVDNMEALITSLGMNSIIDLSDRTDEPVIIREKEYKRNYPLYCIRWYNEMNKRSMKDIFIIRNNSVYFKVLSIESVEPKDKVFCFEMKKTEEPYFTLPNGIITHNCRLRNAIDKNAFAYTLGGTGIATGSKKVFTININRMVQDKRKIRKEIQKIHRYLVAYNEILYDMKAKNMLPVYDAGFISLEQQYLTIGVNGIVESAEFLGMDISYNEKYMTYVQNLLGTIMDTNKEDSGIYSKKMGKKITFNTELVPAENLGVKFAKWDAKDGYKTYRDCYNSYLYRVEDPCVDIIDKFQIHGEETLKHLDGGSAVHINLEELPNKGTWLKIMDRATFYGTNYWTYNVRSTVCNHCGYIDKRDLTSCSKCGTIDVDHATRIIGYLKRITSFSDARQKEAGLRLYHKQ